MRVRFIICSVFSISFFGLHAQENFSANVNIKTEPTDKIDFNETNIGLTYKKKINDTNQFTNTVEYSNLKLNYDSNTYESLPALNRLNLIQNKLEFSHEMSNQFKWILAVTPTAGFEQYLDWKDWYVLGSISAKKQINTAIALEIGAARTTIFGAPKFTPIVNLDYRINESLDLKIGFPDSKFSYSNNARNAFSLMNQFNGSYYHLDTHKNWDTTASKAVLSQMTTAVEYERNVDKNWFLNFKAGYDFNKKYELLNDSNNKVYDFRTGNGYVLGIGIKYKQ
ncbi:DUF6268 family outer membrane beta-barrel protein [Flavobacterium hungaricum]|uniref:DUF6268 domain-containing protein n=1 Tax=Flavobacterium hungaricum TaxID=2082725 RepID=A0ABR9TJM2_9FLAO|nr:DUF6268 family outer membrane beta-barrel protein [Flavobacterium hungaricum]MBE8725558.1 hypothetical protein [Flavobacterium hungaricum]